MGIMLHCERMVTPKDCLVDRVWPWPGEPISGRLVEFSTDQKTAICVTDSGLRFEVLVEDLVKMEYRAKGKA